MKRIVVSDTHIGSKYYRAEQLTQFLREESYDQLILAGDILDLVKIPSFTKKSIDLLNSIDFSKDVIYVVGNHDISFDGLVGQEIFGIKFVKQYEFEEGGRKFRIQHGDQYERGAVHWQLFIKIVSVFHDFLENWLNVNITSWWTNIQLKKRKLRRVWDILNWNHDADVIIVGHTHMPEAIIWVDEDQHIKTYVNCGDWVSHQTYVSIQDGTVRLRKFERSIDERTDSKGDA